MTYTMPVDGINISKERRFLCEKKCQVESGGTFLMSALKF